MNTALVAESYTFAVSIGARGFAELQNEWQSLADRLPRLNFVQCPQWAGGYLYQLTRDRESLRWIVARRAGALVAIWPLQLVRRGFGPIGIQELTGLTHPHLTLSDIVADPVDAALWPHLWNWLLRQSGIAWDRIVVPKLTEESVLAGWIRQYTPDLAQARRIDGSAWLDCERPFDDLLKAASANHRSSLSRGAKRAAGLGGLRYETFTTPATLASAMESFLVLESAGWKGREGGAVACKPELIAFYSGLAQQLGARGQCEIDLLWLGERAIACVFWFRTGRQLHLQKIAYLEEFANLGPGKLIMREALKRACADASLSQVRFITRCVWADGWRTSLIPVWRHGLYRDSVRGRLWAASMTPYEKLKQRVKPWVMRWRERRAVPRAHPSSMADSGPGHATSN